MTSATKEGPLPGGFLNHGLRLVRDAVALGGRLGRTVSVAVSDAAGRTALAGLDALLEWRYTDEALRRVLASPVADRAVGHALSGPLVDAVAHDVARYAVLERVVDELVAGDALERALTRAEVAEMPQRLIDRLLADGIAEQLADRLLDGPELERAIAAALESTGMEQLVKGVVESPAMERLAAHVIESRLLDTIVERLLESEELWLLVDEIARSPAVTEAIGQQGVGFADQVAGRVRLGSQRADAGWSGADPPQRPAPRPPGLPGRKRGRARQGGDGRSGQVVLSLAVAFLTAGWS